MSNILQNLFTVYGPLALGWLIAAIIWYQYQKVIKDYHEAIVDNARVTEKLAMLIEERTRHRFNGQ